MRWVLLAALLAAGACDAQTRACHAADGAYAVDDGGMGCVLTGTSPGACFAKGDSTKCVASCIASEYGLRCGGVPEPPMPDDSLHCRAANYIIGAVGTAFYCCPCVY